MKKNINITLLLLWISALLLLILMLKQLPIESAMTWINGLEYYQWVIWGGINSIIILIYVYRWLLINNGIDFKTNFLKLLLVRQAGQSFSYITPGPQFGGEPLQIYWLWKTDNYLGHKAFLSVALDRIFELWINFSVLCCGIIILMLFSNTDITVWYYSLIICVVMVIGIFLFGRLLISHDSVIISRLKKAIGYWQHSPRLKSLTLHMENVSKDAHSFFIRKPGVFYSTVLVSIIGWMGMLAELWLVLEFLKIKLSIIDFVFLVIAMRLALLLPVPGGVGTIEATIFWVFTSLGLNTFDVVGMIAFIRVRDLAIVSAGMIAFQFLMRNTILQEKPDQINPK